MVLAHEEANGFKHDYIGTEHILLGLLRDSEGFAARVLGSLGLTVERVRGEVVRIVGLGEGAGAGQIPFTPKAKRVIELANRESIGLGHNYVGTEHILLGLVALNDGVAERILLDLDAGPDKVRREVMQMLSAAGALGRPRNDSAHAPEPPRSGFDEWIRVGPGAGARRLLTVAAGRALDDGRSEIEARDVLLALARDEKMAPVLAELGVDEAAILEALARRRGNRPPPQTPPNTSSNGPG